VPWPEGGEVAVEAKPPPFQITEEHRRRSQEKDKEYEVVKNAIADGFAESITGNRSNAAHHAVEYTRALILCQVSEETIRLNYPL